MIKAIKIIINTTCHYFFQVYTSGLVRRDIAVSFLSTKTLPIPLSQQYIHHITLAAIISYIFILKCTIRSPLFGFKKPAFFPYNFLLGLFGGHFSPIVGYMVKEDLVAVFDVNHEYGVYLLSSRRLYDSVNTFDFTSKQTRGLVLTELHVE